jgi:hypothetical protein
MQNIKIDDAYLVNELTSISDDADYLSLEAIHPRNMLDPSANLIYLLIGIPAVYVLKKLSDEAINRFSKWTVDKIASLFKTYRPALIELRAKLKPESNEIVLCSLEYPILNADSEQIARDMTPIILLVIKALQSGLVFVDVELMWDEKEQGWLIRKGHIKALN